MPEYTAQNGVSDEVVWHNHMNGHTLIVADKRIAVMNVCTSEAEAIHCGASAHCYLQLSKHFSLVHSCNSPYLHVNWRWKAGPAIPFPPCRCQCWSHWQRRLFRPGSRTVRMGRERPHRWGRFGNSSQSCHLSHKLRQSAQAMNGTTPLRYELTVRGIDWRHIPGARFSIAIGQVVFRCDRQPWAKFVFAHVVTLPFSLFVVYFSHARV